MALTKEVEAGSINRLKDGQIEYREDTVIYDNGVEIARTLHREVLDPANTITATDARGVARPQILLDSVALYHTPTIKAARQVFLDSKKP